MKLVPFKTLFSLRLPGDWELDVLVYPNGKIRMVLVKVLSLPYYTLSDLPSDEFMEQINKMIGGV